MIRNEPLILSVSQLNRYVKAQFDADAHLYSVFLVGEISNFTDHYKTGHFYFSLKDETAQIKAVMFRSAAQRIRFRPENGLKVLVRGRVSLYEAGGSYQIFVDDMQPDGVGALNLAFEQLKVKLEKQGLFDPARKKPLPKYPETIGVITSETGAAIQDILQILRRRCPQVQVVLAPVLVQGEHAPAQMIAALEQFNAAKAADILIIGRGGGSVEDLWAFNDESLALVVSRSKIPVISAVGHETDYTICDFVADLRAPTPSAAAELAAPEQIQLRAAVSALQARMQMLAVQQLRNKKQDFAVLCGNRTLTDPSLFLDSCKMRLALLQAQLGTAAEKTLANAQSALQSAAAKLDTLSPLSVLSRGYSIVTDSTDTVIRSVSALQIQESVKLRLHDGTAVCTVKEIL